jgi:hypothetical protein
MSRATTQKPRNRIEAEPTQAEAEDFAMELTSLRRRKRDCESRVMELEGMIRATLAAVREAAKKAPPLGYCEVCRQVVPYALDGPRIFKPHTRRGKPCRATGEESPHSSWVGAFHPVKPGDELFVSRGGWRNPPKWAR